jgi:hypothetical protein
METTEKKKPPKPPPPKLSWFLNPVSHKLFCIRTPGPACIVTSLWEASGEFYDPRLMRATKEINDILERLSKENKDRNKELSFIEVENRLLLVWTEHGMIGPDDDPGTIKKALGLKEEKRKVVV